jgi:thiol-disulfide isomerase/thioredoxin
MLVRSLVILVVGLGLLPGCPDSKVSDAPAPSRVNAAKRDTTSKAASSFCEAVFPGGESKRAFVEPATVTLGTDPPAAKAGAWRWVNLWATWCKPCVEEMALLGKWQESLAKDGLPIQLELWSVDDDNATVQSFASKNRMPPAKQRRLSGGAADLSAALKALGVDEKSPIPVHALIDGSGGIRCVRVGSVGDESYAAVKTILAGG